MADSQEQKKKHHNYDWLNGYKFVKGQSGNPGGRPKGSKSLKTFAKEYLETLPEDEKVKFLAALPPEIVWKMAEGNPHNSNDLTSDGKPLVISFDPTFNEDRTD
jgi:hypothetical protein